jgi:hypothetical protein
LIDELRDFDAACSDYWAAVGAKQSASIVRRWGSPDGRVLWEAYCDAAPGDAVLGRLGDQAPTPEAALVKATAKVRDATARRLSGTGG